MMNNLIIFVVIFISSFINFQLGVYIEKRRITKEFEKFIIKAFHDGWDAGWGNGFDAGVQQEKQRP